MTQDAYEQFVSKGSPMPARSSGMELSNFSTSAPIGVHLVSANRLSPKPINWVIPGWLARGKLTVLAGHGGSGKSNVAIGIAAMVSIGDASQLDAATTPGRVLIWSAEDDIEDTIIPRLVAAGADRENVSFVEGATRAFDPSVDMPELSEKLAEHEDVSLLIIDPIVSAVSGDSHKNAEVRRGLQPVLDAAVKSGFAVLGITHLSKGTAGRDPVERVTGSIAFGALARFVLMTGRSKEDPENRFITLAKSNNSSDGGGFQYRLELEDICEGSIDVPAIQATRAVFGEKLYGSASDIFEQAEQIESEASPREREAIDFVRSTLTLGEIETRELNRLARDAGIAERTLERARKALGVKNRKVGARWMVSLPEPDITNSASVNGYERSADLGSNLTLVRPLADLAELGKAPQRPRQTGISTPPAIPPSTSPTTLLQEPGGTDRNVIKGGVDRRATQADEPLETVVGSHHGAGEGEVRL